MKFARVQSTTSVTLLLAILSTIATAKERPAPRFDGLGKLHHPVTTKSKAAQEYFDQGLTLTYAFNHAEAARSFKEVTRLDPTCAMGYWGAALVLGPNINAPMDTTVVAEAHETVLKAQRLAATGKTSPKERDMIDALAKRYTAKPLQDRKPLDEAYAGAMREVAKRFPDDPDIGALAAEALMDLHPWNFWLKSGEAQPWTAEIVAQLEAVLAKAPEHVGATHFYIHAVEASRTPGRAEKYADQLGVLVPGAGHLVHMPSHTYIRLGRYHAAALANIKARDVDEQYISQCHAQGVYPLGYVPHNHHFLWVAASMEGWSEMALAAAQSTVAKTNHDMMREPGLATLQHYAWMPLYASVRFGKWNDILATPAPPADLLYPTGLWHYARGRAFVAQGKLDEAERELVEAGHIAAMDTLEKITIWDINNTASLMRIAVEVLAAELQAKRGDYDVAVRRLTEAVRLEDALNYDEPPTWDYPVRHSLGAVLLEAGRAAEAEAVYRQDLVFNPENGWSLFGLAESLEKQGKIAEAAEVEARFAKAWKNADVKLTASRF